jgi:hypothetical protein
METKGIDLDNTDKEHMKTLASCINSLASVGYETQFKLIKGSGLKSLSTEKIYRPEDVKITNFYRFEGESDPADSSILYAIETTTGEKGTLSDAYGAYSDANISAFIKEVEDIEKRAHKTEDKKEE